MPSLVCWRLERRAEGVCLQLSRLHSAYQKRRKSKVKINYVVVGGGNGNGNGGGGCSSLFALLVLLSDCPLWRCCLLAAYKVAGYPVVVFAHFSPSLRWRPHSSPYARATLHNTSLLLLSTRAFVHCCRRPRPLPLPLPRHRRSFV